VWSEVPALYAITRKRLDLPAHKMADEAAGHTLEPTALVHEAWLRLGGDVQPHWQNRAHFFAAAAEAMRRVLIDRARTKRAARHGGGWERVELEAIDAPTQAGEDLLFRVRFGR
jgi:RNA polymerase sigma factor (TIGR02999 family)